MARIRSIHPGLFTDDAFMSASSQARVLLLGLWTEAWDDGVFEWKPVTLKARVLPVDNVNIPALLSELTSLNFIRQFSFDHKQYGAIRNFRKFQRPKKPNSSGVLPAEFRTYVGLSQRHDVTGTEIPPQMEDEGEGIPSDSVEPRSLGEVILHPHARGRS
jgi:hypothetical protein